MHVNQTLKPGATNWLTVSNFEEEIEAKYSLYTWLRRPHVNPPLQRDTEHRAPDLRIDAANCGITQWRKLTNLL